MNPKIVTLKGNSTKDRFKGFVIQPLIYDGSRHGQRMGQFMRLDDNGSWQQQCFRLKDSVTHSHDEKKKQMRMWWKNDEDDTQTVQFVATVVVSLRKFWVKTVLSDPIPPCRMRKEFGPWNRPPITSPPPVSRFKMEAFHMFNQDSSNLLEQSISATAVERPRPVFPQTPAVPQFTQAPFNPQPSIVQFTRAPFAQQPVQPQRFDLTTPSFATTTQRPQFTMRQRLTHVIPLPDMEMNHRPRQPPRVMFTTTQQPFTVATVTQRRFSFFRQTARPVFRGNVSPQAQQQQGTCSDVDAPTTCFRWLPYCSTSGYMRNFCRRTCHFC
ncbi:Protein F23B12.4 a [Aphelenchoides avenae]|nr:Protein F23B12.4 a [Aphelenchus avenae]